jgi:hypothetical protein
VEKILILYYYEGVNYPNSRFWLIIRAWPWKRKNISDLLISSVEDMWLFIREIVSFTTVTNWPNNGTEKIFNWSNSPSNSQNRKTKSRKINKIRFTHVIPPYNGYGIEEDSLGSVFSLMPKPPKKDVKKMFSSD